MFTNSIGQKIVPGDRVVGITQGYSHNIGIREGIFVGLSPAGSPQIRAKHKVFGYWNSAGVNVGWRNSKQAGIVAEHRHIERVTTLHAKRVYKLA